MRRILVLLLFCMFINMSFTYAISLRESQNKKTIDAIERLPINVRESILDQAQELINDFRNIQSSSWNLLIKSLQDLGDSRDRIIAYTRQLLISNHSLSNINTIINGLNNVAEIDRQHLINETKNLCETLDINLRTFVQIDNVFLALSKVSADNRPVVIDHVRRIFSSTGTNDQLSEIICHLNKAILTSQNLDTLIAQANTLYRNSSSNCPIYLILDTLLKTPVSKRSDLVERLEKFMVGGVQHRLTFTKKMVLSKPKEDILNLSEHFANLVNYQTSNGNSWIPQPIEDKLIEYLGTLSSEQRATFIRDVMTIAPIVNSDFWRFWRTFQINIPEDQKLNRLERAARNIGPRDNINRILEMLETPMNQPLRGVATQVGVHAPGRDASSKRALLLLVRSQEGVDKDTLLRSYQEFNDYIDNLPDGTEKRKVGFVLTNDRATLPNGIATFGGLFRAKRIYNTFVSGQDLIARLNHFANTYSNGEEAENIKRGIISGLINSIEADGHIVCPEGITQRLLIATIQGRLSRADIDMADVAPTITDAQLSAMFFTPARQEMDREGLLREVEIFITEHRNVNPDQLRRIVNGYIAESDL